MVVLDDFRVLRIVLFFLEVNFRFWIKWDDLKIDFFCVNVYSLFIKKLEVFFLYLGFLLRVFILAYSSLFKFKS